MPPKKERKTVSELTKKYGKYGQINSVELKYLAELRVLCPFCKVVHTAEVKMNLNFEDDYMEAYPDWGPFYSLWVTVTCEGCGEEIYIREHE